MPKPPETFLSRKEIGQGFKISKNLNNIKPSKIKSHLNGSSIMVIRNPTISSQTIPEKSWIFISSETFWHIQIPETANIRVRNKYQNESRHIAIAIYMGIAAKVPKVPGAFGDNPLPKPKARKCQGLDQTLWLILFSLKMIISPAHRANVFSRQTVELFSI